MGLDSYLKAEKFVSGYDFDPKQKEANLKIKEALGFTAEEYPESSLTVSITVGYWRKANAIHAWFVDNCQGGVDECQKTLLSPNDLGDLLSVCKEAIETKNAGLLQPRGGFFFGSTDVDEYYWNDIQNTIDIITKILNDPRLQGCDFYYQASW